MKHERQTMQVGSGVSLLHLFLQEKNNCVLLSNILWQQGPEQTTVDPSLLVIKYVLSSSFSLVFLTSLLAAIFLSAPCTAAVSNFSDACTVSGVHCYLDGLRCSLEDERSDTLLVAVLVHDYERVWKPWCYNKTKQKIMCMKNNTGTVLALSMTSDLD